MNNQLLNYIANNEDPVFNFELGLEYEKIGQTSSAITFFLRAAERAHDIDKNISYESLIHMGHCFDSQGRRQKTVNSCWKKALTLLPRRPEAYYYLSRLNNWNNDYDQGYVYSSLALEICDFDSVYLMNTDYVRPDSYLECILFEKGLSSWWWGKVEESTSIFVDLHNSGKKDKLPYYQKGILDKYLKENMKIEL